ncbi:hypothetical protein BH23CHL10_BH23CHL10_17170 [soil metagenome]
MTAAANSSGNSDAAQLGKWQVVRLAHLVQRNRAISYGIVQPGKVDVAGVPIVRVTDVRGGRIASDRPLRVAPEVEASYARTRLQGGELLVTLVGTVGESAIVPPQLEGWNVARAIAVIPIRDDIGARWVHWALQDPAAKRFIADRVNTTVQTTLNLRDLAELPIQLPPIEEQRAIASVLGALDDKIELNRRMNETLEALARAIFTSWFVDFDPVRAKAEGRQPVGMDAETAALFPDSFEDSPLGPIPSGWQALPLDRLATFLNGLALQRYQPTGVGDLPAIKIPELRAGVTSSTGRASADVPEQYVVADGDVLFSWSGSLVAVLWAGGIGALNQHLFRVTSNEYPRWLYYFWIREHLETFRQIAAGKATTMGHIQRGHLSQADCIVPPMELLRRTSDILEPMLDAIVSHGVESRSVTAIRDALLPKLVSGEIRIAADA